MFLRSRPHHAFYRRNVSINYKFNLITPAHMTTVTHKEKSTSQSKRNAIHHADDSPITKLDFTLNLKLQRNVHLQETSSKVGIIIFLYFGSSPTRAALRTIWFITKLLKMNKIIMTVYL